MDLTFGSKCSILSRRMRETLLNLVDLVRRNILPVKGLMLFMHLLANSENKFVLSEIALALKFDPKLTLCLTSMLRLLKLVTFIENEDGLYFQITPILSNRKMRSLLRNPSRLKKLRSYRVRVISASVDSNAKYGGPLETILKFLPAKHCTFPLDYGRLRYLNQISKEVDIEQYIRWFLTNKLYKMKIFTLDVFLMSAMVNEFRDYQRSLND